MQWLFSVVEQVIVDQNTSLNFKWLCTNKQVKQIKQRKIKSSASIKACFFSRSESSVSHRSSFPYLHSYAVIIQLVPSELLSFSFHVSLIRVWHYDEWKSGAQGFSILKWNDETHEWKQEKEREREAGKCVYTARVIKIAIREMFMALWMRKSFTHDLAHFQRLRHLCQTGCSARFRGWSCQTASHAKRFSVQ